MTARTRPTEILVSPGVIEALAYAVPDAVVELTADRAFLTLDNVRYVAFLRPTAVAS